MLAILAVIPLYFSATVCVAADGELVVIGEKAVYRYAYPEIGQIFGELYLKEADSVVDDICYSEKVVPKNARIAVDSNGVISVKEGVPGKIVDRAKLKADVSDALAVGGGTVRVRFTDLMPEICAEDLKDCTFLRGSFTTSFYSDKDRITNIRLATRLLNGTMVGDNEIFSFNDTVGERTERRGFKTAKIIVNGNFVEGVGGGVCQASTTLYNCSLLSGLEAVEHHRHSLAVSYVEKSFDAMVSGSSSDLKFRNNTGKPVFIFGKTDCNSVTFSIYGRKNDYSVVRESVILKEITPSVSTVKNKELAFGETRVLVFPKTGYCSEAYLNYYKDGKLVRRTKIREDVYHAVNGITEVGENDAEN